MCFLRQAYVLTIGCVVIAATSLSVDAQLPDRATIFYAHAHPDDEGIFGGGVLPYYSQVRGVPVTVYSIVTRSANGADPLTAGGGVSRVAELRRAMDTYAGQALDSGATDALGHYQTGNITMVEAGLIDTGCCGANPTDSWSDAGDGYGWGTSSGVTQVTPGFGNIDGISDGRTAAAWGMAREIRRYRPDVVVAPHDLEGDYGHSNHTATAIAIIDAYDLAADSNVDIDGLTAWRPQKLYLRGDLNDNRSSISWTGFSSDGGINPLFHDFFEDQTIGTQSPRGVADNGLDLHASQGRPDVSTVFRDGENFDGHHSEWWTLYRTTVGPDSLEATFTVTGDVTGREYTEWARGDFLENIVLFPNGWNGTVGDVNQDGVVDSDDVTDFQIGWNTVTTGLSGLDRYMLGDMDLSGLTDLADAFILHQALADAGNQMTLREILGFAVPEPSATVLVLVGAFATLAGPWSRRLYREACSVS